MTREEAIKMLKAIKKGNYLGGIIDIPSDESTAFDMAIKALDQETCEDAISRSSLLGKFDYCYKEKIKTAPDNMAEGFMQVEKLIKQELPVTPARKKGKWINGNPICPCCGEDKFKDLDADIWADWQPKYCPNCGAEMETEQ